MSKPVQISDSELILMRLIWENGGRAHYAEIMEALRAQGLEWKKNTVLTFLSRLVEKGCLAASKTGRRNAYTALLAQDDYSADQTRLFLDRVYEGNVGGLVSTLLQNGFVSDEEKEKLRRFWEDAGEHE